MACGCSDGHVKFWDTAGKVASSSDGTLEDSLVCHCLSLSYPAAAAADFISIQTQANKNATVAGVTQIAIDPLNHFLVAASATGLVSVFSTGKTVRARGLAYPLGVCMYAPPPDADPR